MGLIFGGLQVSAAVSQANHYARVTKLALLGQKGVALATTLEEERAQTAMDLAVHDGSSQTLSKDLAAWYGPPTSNGSNVGTKGRTGRAADAFNQAATGIDSSYPASVLAPLANVQGDVINILPGLRSEAWSAGTLPPAGGQLGPVVFYSLAVGSIFQLDDAIALNSGDSVLLQDVQQLGALSRAADQISQQRAIVWAALTSYAKKPGPYSGRRHAGSPANLAQQQIEQTLLTSEAQQAGYLGTFEAAATPAENQELLTTAFQQPSAKMLGIENYIVQQHSYDITPLGFTTSPATAAAYWNTTSSHAATEYGRAGGAGRAVHREPQRTAPAQRVACGMGDLDPDRGLLPAGTARGAARGPVGGAATAAAAGRSA